MDAPNERMRVQKREHHPTHTWRERHSLLSASLAETLRERGVIPETVLEIGPGGIAKSYAGLFPKGKLSRLGKLQKSLVTVLESATRDRPSEKLESYETQEIFRLLQPLGLKRLIVADKFPKVLDVVLEKNRNDVLGILCDIERARVGYPLPGEGADMTIALSVLSRCKANPEFALKTIAESVKRGGYLVSNLNAQARESLPLFQRVGDWLYQKEF